MEKRKPCSSFNHHNLYFQSLNETTLKAQCRAVTALLHGAGGSVGTWAFAAHDHLCHVIIPLSCDSSGRHCSGGDYGPVGARRGGLWVLNQSSGLQGPFNLPYRTLCRIHLGRGKKRKPQLYKMSSVCAWLCTQTLPVTSLHFRK